MCTVWKRQWILFHMLIKQLGCTARDVILLSSYSIFSSYNQWSKWNILRDTHHSFGCIVLRLGRWGVGGEVGRGEVGDGFCWISLFTVLCLVLVDACEWTRVTCPALTSSWKDRKQASCQYNTLPYWMKIPVPFSSWIVIHGHHYLLVLLTTLFKSYWTKDKWGSEKEKESISIGMLHLFAPSVATQKKILFFYKFELLKANSVIQSTMIQYKQQMLQFQTQWYGIDIKWFSSKHSNITKKCSNWKHSDMV